MIFIINVHNVLKMIIDHLYKINAYVMMDMLMIWNLFALYVMKHVWLVKGKYFININILIYLLLKIIINIINLNIN